MLLLFALSALLLLVVGCCWLLVVGVWCCWLLLVVVGCCWLLLVVVGCCFRRCGAVSRPLPVFQRFCYVFNTFSDHARHHDQRVIGNVLVSNFFCSRFH